MPRLGGMVASVGVVGKHRYNVVNDIFIGVKMSTVDAPYTHATNNQLKTRRISPRDTTPVAHYYAAKRRRNSSAATGRRALPACLMPL